MADGLGLKIGAATSVAVSSTPTGGHDALVRPTDTHLDTDDHAAALADLADRSGSTATSVVVACPNGWDEQTVASQREAAAAHGLSDATFVPEAVASVAAATAAGGDLDGTAGDGTPLVVFDLGASALDIAVVQAQDGTHAIVGTPARSTDISGDAIDQLLYDHVLQSAGVAGAIDASDPTTAAALEVLLRRCTAAKEALSTDTGATLAVDVAGVTTDIRVTRSQLESLAQQQIFASMTLLREAVASSGHRLRDVGALLLTGGGASMPLVTEMLSGVLHVPVVVDSDPTTTSAFGAAILASQAGTAGAAGGRAGRAAAGTASLSTLGAASMSKRIHAVAPAATTSAEPSERSGRNRRVALIGAAVAVALLSAGGLAVAASLNSGGDPADESVATAINPLASSTAASTPVARPGGRVSAVVTPTPTSSVNPADAQAQARAQAQSAAQAQGQAQAQAQAQQQAQARAAGGNAAAGAPAQAPAAAAAPSTVKPAPVTTATPTAPQSGGTRPGPDGTRGPLTNIPIPKLPTVNIPGLPGFP